MAMTLSEAVERQLGVKLSDLCRAHLGQNRRRDRCLLRENVNAIILTPLVPHLSTESRTPIRQVPTMTSTCDT